MILKRLGFLAGLHLAKPVLSLLFRLNRHHIVNEGALKKALASDRPVMICCWHGRLLFPFYFLRGHGYYAVAGLHEDAEIISQLGWRMGWRMIRGSSTRGGTGAFQRMVTALRKPGEVVAMTPDGPKGPRQKAKQGAVRTAMRTGAVIVPVSGQATRRWNVVNWDTFVVPKPLGKVVLVFGNPMDVYSGGPESSRALEEKLNSVQDMADAIAVDKA